MNFRIRLCSSNTDKVRSIWGHDFSKTNGDNKVWGFSNFIKRSHVLDQSKGYLEGGHATIEVDIQVMQEEGLTWKPASSRTLCSDMLKILDSANEDEENSTADVVFIVGKGRKTKKRSGAERFYAHSSILSVRAPMLATLAEEHHDESKPIPIEDMEPDMFRSLLRYVYGGELPDEKELALDACTFIEVANRFQCTGLKLEAESALVATGVDADNCADMILFAEAHNCALLQEAATDCFVKNSDTVIGTDGYEKIKESRDLLEDLLCAALSGSNGKRFSSSVENDDDGRDYKRMRVAELRTKLEDRDLDVDGSKGMLISRLEEFGKEDDEDDYD